MNGRLILYFAGYDQAFEMKPQGEILAGLSEFCGLNLTRYFSGRVRTISRQHFKLVYFPDEGYVIVDLNSLNGTRVNAERLTPYQPRFLKHGDVIEVANNPEFMIEVSMDEGSFTEAATSIARSLRASMGQSGLRFDGSRQQFSVDGRPIPHSHLTRLEHDLLLYLFRHAGRVCSYDELAEHVWDGYVQNNTIAKGMSNLRQKLEATAPGASQLITTVHGRGFMFDNATEVQ